MFINKGQIEHEYTKASESVTFLHDIVYDGKVYGDKGFDDLPKYERVAIIGLLNDAINYRNSLGLYLNWFESQETN